MDPNSTEKLMKQFHHLSRLIHKRQHSSRGVDLLRGQGRVLRALYKQDGQVQQELAKEVRIQPGSLSELLAKLEQKNHIARTVDPTDKRRYTITITEEGRELADQIMVAKNEASQEIFSVLTPKEQQVLMVLFQKLLVGLDIEEEQE